MSRGRPFSLFLDLGRQVVGVHLGALELWGDRLEQLAGVVVVVPFVAESLADQVQGHHCRRPPEEAAS